MTFIKNTVACLALANILYFLWAHGVAQSPEPASTQQPKPLKLVSEAGDTERAAVVPNNGVAESGSDGATAAAAGPGPVPGLRRCVSVGPFREMSEAAHAASTLRAGGYDPRQRVAEGDVWAGVWVYLPVPPSSAASEQLLAKLKLAGIDDALEMPGPADGSVISLGLYSEQKRAQARVAQAQALGFNPGIADRKRTGNLYWLDVDLKPADGLLNPTDLQGEGGRISRLETKTCPSGAPL